MAQPKHGYENEYSDNGFWNKVVTDTKAAGRDVIQKALWLHYTAQNPATPAWAKSVIYGALGYFIFPIDAIPDITAVVGYADDLGVVVAAVTTVMSRITPEVKSRAALKLKEWFGN